MHPIFLRNFPVEIPVVEFSILHTVFKLLFPCFLQDVSKGIVKRNGYKNVQEFYKIYHKSHGAYTAYKEQETKWEKIHGTDSQKQNKESIHERLKNPSKKTTDYQQQMTVKGKDRRAR